MPADLLVGDPGPELEAVAVGSDVDAGSALVRLKDLRGRRVVLVFHPTNDASAALDQACALRDAWSAIGNSAVFFGVDPASPDAHRQTIDRLALPFPILTDENHRIARSYGLWLGDGGGGDVEGGESIRPSTFILGADGRVEAVWREGTPHAHVKWLIRMLSQ